MNVKHIYVNYLTMDPSIEGFYIYNGVNFARIANSNIRLI
jgi:hypothetical protein